MSKKMKIFVGLVGFVGFVGFLVAVALAVRQYDHLNERDSRDVFAGMDGSNVQEDVNGCYRHAVEICFRGSGLLSVRVRSDGTGQAQALWLEGRETPLRDLFRESGDCAYRSFTECVEGTTHRWSMQIRRRPYVAETTYRAWLPGYSPAGPRSSRP